jgi:hypothetical protein
MKTLFTGYTKLHRNLFFYSALLLTLLASVWVRAEQVTLAWNPNQESDLAGYKIYYGTASGSYAVRRDVQRVTTYTLTGLAAGQTYYFATTAYDTSGDESSYSNEVSYYVPNPNQAVTYTIWKPTAAVGFDPGGDSPVELGVKFRSDSNGYIHGIRFYKYALNTGLHIGNLWTSDGALLGSVTFTGETSSGWQQANFKVPIPISANTTYIASYHATAGHWAKSPNYFTSAGADNGPLHALRSGVDGLNGVYRYGAAGSFPNQSCGTNYWVDVVLAYNVSTPATDTDGDGLSDELEIGTYGTDPNLADTDGDGIPDGQEVALWGQKWNSDIDGDGVINLLDWDSDWDGFSDGEEVAKGTNPSSKGSKVAALPMEAGEVTVDHNWKQVNFGRQFLNPVVVTGGMSANGSRTAVVRIRNVTGSGFEIRIQEWDCYDGLHVMETVGYLAVESGVHTLAGNLKVEAGQFVHIGGKVFISRSFQEVFPETPVVMAAVATFSDPAAIVVRLSEITTKGFSIRLQEQEANVQDHGAEMISYIAWLPSSGSFDGIRFEVDKTAMVVNHRFMEIPFMEPHATTPVFLGQMQSTYGRNPAGVQWQGKDTGGVEVRISEETSRDRETKHASEVVGFMVFSAAK